MLMLAPPVHRVPVTRSHDVKKAVKDGKPIEK